MPPAIAEFLHLLSTSWQGLAAVAGIAFGVGMLGSLLTAFISSSTSESSDVFGSLGSSFGTYVATSIQLLQMANGGILTANTGAISGLFNGSVSMMLTPWFVTLLILAAAAVSARFFAPKGLSRLTRVAWSAVLGLGYAVVLTVLGAVVPIGASSTTISATGAPSFFGAVLLVAGGTYVGLATITVADLHRPWVAAFASVVAFMVVAAVVVLLVFVVYALIKEPKLLASVPLMGPMMLWWGTVIAGAGTISLDGSLATSLASLSGTDLTSNLWSGDLPVWAWAGLVVFFVLVVASGIFAGALSRPEQRSWYRIPIAWVSVALVLQLAMTIRIWIDGAGSLTSNSSHGAVGAAPYTFLIFGLWSALAAASAQYLTGHVIGYLPAFLRESAPVPPPPPSASSGFGMDASVSQPTAPGAPEPTAVIPPAAAAYTAPPAPAGFVSAPVDQPVAPALVAAPVARKKLSRKAKTGIIVGVGALSFVIIAAIAAGVVRGSVFSPQAKALAFMSSLEQGHAHDAATALGVEPSPLFTDEIYGAATNRPSKAAVSTATVVGDTATVTVSYQRNGQSLTADLTLNRTGTDWLVADRWVIVEGTAGMSTMSMSWPNAAGPRSFSVNGVDLPAPPADSDGSVDYQAFPGTYTVTAKPDANFKAETQTWDTDSLDDSVEFSAEPTDALQTALVNAVRTRINECAKSTEAVPARCPFSVASEYSSSSYSKVSYRIGTIPPLQIPNLKLGRSDNSGWNVQSDSYGVVYKTYTYAGLFEPYTVTDESGSYYVSAHVDIENGKLNVTFQ